MIHASQMFIIFFIILTLFYIFFIDIDISRNFFITVILIIIIILNIHTKQHELQSNNNIFQFIDLIERDIQDISFNFQDIYKIHKAPSKLKHLRIHSSFLKLIYDIRYIKKYNKSKYLTIIVLCEYFLKEHYNIITKECNNIVFKLNILSDIKHEIYNTLQSFVFEIPDNDNNRIIMLEYVTNLHSLLTEYINIILTKYNININTITENIYDVRKNQYYNIV